jgi:nucleotide-binding universal stress UspA family protein
MYQRILVPTDGSELAAVAADAAISFAQACGGEIVALSVAYPEPVLLSAEGAVAAGSEMGVDVLLEQAQQYVGQLADVARKAGVGCTAFTAYGYSPADEIVDMAERQHCDLIFIASHGRRGLSRLIAGSVTQRVLACSPVPVMVYRPHTAHARGGLGQDSPGATRARG